MTAEQVSKVRGIRMPGFPIKDALLRTRSEKPKTFGDRLVPFSFLGVSLYWAWVFLACFDGLLYRQTEIGYLSQTNEFVSLLFYVLVFFISTMGSRSIVLNWSNRRLSVFPLIATCGTLLAALAPLLPDRFILGGVVFGAALGGIGTGVLIILWGRFYTSMNPTCTPYRVALALLTSVAIYFVVSLLPYPGFLVVTALLPTASFLSGTLIKRSTEHVSFETRTPKKQLHPRKLGMGLISAGLAFGLVFAASLQVLSTGEVLSLSCQLANLVIGVAILLYTFLTKRNMGFSPAYMAILPISVLGLFLYALFGLAGLPGSFTLVRAGYVLFDMLIWLQLPHIFAQTHSFKTFSYARLCLDGGTLLGMTLCYLYLMQSWLSFDWLLLVTTAVLLCTLTYSLATGNVENAWSLLPAARNEAIDFDSACWMIAKKHRLTDREAEVMALVARGRSGAYIQEKLCITLNTVQTHSKNIYHKLGIPSRQELLSIIEGYIDLG
jgi:DNA-binding CsgD family transcriptional regulator